MGTEYLDDVPATTQSVNYTKHRPYLEKLFQKYGHADVLTFEGFEHLLQSLGLANIAIRDHELHDHIVQGTFKDFHEDHDHEEEEHDDHGHVNYGVHDPHTEHEHEHEHSSHSKELERFEVIPDDHEHEVTEEEEEGQGHEVQAQSNNQNGFHDVGDGGDEMGVDDHEGQGHDAHAHTEHSSHSKPPAPTPTPAHEAPAQDNQSAHSTADHTEQSTHHHPDSDSHEHEHEHRDDFHSNVTSDSRRERRDTRTPLRSTDQRHDSTQGQSQKASGVSNRRKRSMRKDWSEDSERRSEKRRVAQVAMRSGSRVVTNDPDVLRDLAARGVAAVSGEMAPTNGNSHKVSKTKRQKRKLREEVQVRVTRGRRETLRHLLPKSNRCGELGRTRQGDEGAEERSCSRQNTTGSKTNVSLGGLKMKRWAQRSETFSCLEGGVDGE